MVSAILLCVQSNVIGIDFGTHWLKVSIIKPGGVLETVLNRESKRKTTNILTLRDGIRYFGFDAVSLGMRFPEITFSSLKNLLGKRYHDPAAVDYRNSYPNNMVEDAKRKTCNFMVGETQYRTEELVAMLLSHAKDQAEKYAQVSVSGAVIAVPPYWTHLERQAMLDAADLANLRVFALINDQTAGIPYLNQWQSTLHSAKSLQRRRIMSSMIWAPVQLSQLQSHSIPAQIKKQRIFWTFTSKQLGMMILWEGKASMS